MTFFKKAKFKKRPFSPKKKKPLYLKRETHIQNKKINKTKGKEERKKKNRRTLKINIGKEIHWDWFAGLVPKRTSQIQKEPFAAGEWGC